MNLSSRWLKCFSQYAAEKPHILCVPFAGGAASAFSGWARHIQSMNVIGAQLPGRETRFSEQPLRDVDSIVAGLCGAFEDCTTHPYALFGHSLGGLIAFELARRLARENMPPPIAVFVAGIDAPDGRRREKVFNLPTDRLLKYLGALGGLPTEITDQPALLELLLPVVRADLQVYDDYVYVPGAYLDCPLYALIGSDDRDISAANAIQWRRQTLGSFTLAEFPGGHFFAFDDKGETALMVEHVVQQRLKSTSGRQITEEA